MELLSHGQILQDKDYGRSRGELDPACGENKETTYFSFLRSRRPPSLPIHRKPPSGSKREGRHPRVGDVDLPISLCAGIHLGYEMRTHTGEDPEIKQKLRTRQSKTGQRKLGRTAPQE